MVIKKGMISIMLKEVSAMPQRRNDSFLKTLWGLFPCEKRMEDVMSTPFFPFEQASSCLFLFPLSLIAQHYFYKHVMWLIIPQPSWDFFQLSTISKIYFS